MPAAPCPVCRTAGVEAIPEVDGRRYWRCPHCDARFLDPAQRPDAACELAHYRQHRNAVDDPAYRRFLSRLAEPLLKRLPKGVVGLDYGCGPGPALAVMLREAGHPTVLYDPFFHPERAALERRYDFIACSEVAEHFHAPAEEFDRFDRLLRPGGWLGVMTCFHSDDIPFAAWHYRRDPTHVVFYRAETFRRIAADRGWTCEFPARDVALLSKPASDQAGIGIGALTGRRCGGLDSPNRHCPPEHRHAVRHRDRPLS